MFVWAPARVASVLWLLLCAALGCQGVSTECRRTTASQDICSCMSRMHQGVAWSWQSALEKSVFHSWWILLERMYVYGAFNLTAGAGVYPAA